MRECVAKKGHLPCVAWVGIGDASAAGLVGVPVTACRSSLAWFLLILVFLDCLESPPVH